MLGKTTGGGGKSPTESDEAHGAITACCGLGAATKGGKERGEKRKEGLGAGGVVLAVEVFGLERPGGGPVLRSMLGAEAQ